MLKLHFVEASPALRKIQRDAVPEARFHGDLATLPDDRPLLVIGNEFLDALPVRQLIRTPAGWREVTVATEGERFVCVPGARPMDAAVPEALRDAGEGTLIETSPAAAAVLYEVAGRLTKQGGAALFIDYGHAEERTGSTFQAVRAHRKVDPFEAPGERGEIDVSGEIGFARIAQSRDSRWLGTVGQGQWLRALGIDARAEALSLSAPQHREALHRARDRLVDADQMGELFKVMGLAAPGWPDGAGFER